MPSRQYIEIEEEPHWIMKYITLLCRGMGIITGMIFWWFTIEIVSTSESVPFIGWYMVGMVIFYTFIEAIWLMDKCRCCDDRGCCCTVWKIFLWIDAWRKTIIYILIAFPMFMAEYRMLYSLVPGGFLVFCGVFYFMKSFKHCHCGAKQRLRSKYADEAERPEVAASHTQSPAPPVDATDTMPLKPEAQP